MKIDGLHLLTLNSLLHIYDENVKFYNFPNFNINSDREFNLINSLKFKDNKKIILFYFLFYKIDFLNTFFEIEEIDKKELMFFDVFNLYVIREVIGNSLTQNIIELIPNTLSFLNKTKDFFEKIAFSSKGILEKLEDNKMDLENFFMELKTMKSLNFNKELSTLSIFLKESFSEVKEFNNIFYLVRQRILEVHKIHNYVPSIEEYDIYFFNKPSLLFFNKYFVRENIMETFLINSLPEKKINKLFALSFLIRNLYFVYKNLDNKTVNQTLLYFLLSTNLNDIYNFENFSEKVKEKFNLKQISNSSTRSIIENNINQLPQYIDDKNEVKQKFLNLIFKLGEFFANDNASFLLEKVSYKAELLKLSDIIFKILKEKENK